MRKWQTEMARVPQQGKSAQSDGKGLQEARAQGLHPAVLRTMIWASSILKTRSLPR